MNGNEIEIKIAPLPPLAKDGEKNDLVDFFQDQSARIYNTVMQGLAQVPQVAQMLKESSQTVLAADIPNKVQKLINKGVLNFVKDKNGNLLALLKENGRIVHQIRLKEVKLPDGDNLAGNISNLVLHAQMAQIITRLEGIQGSINRVIQGQQNDRRAMALSGEQQFLTAQSMISPDTKRAVLINAFQTANQAQNMLQISLRQETDFICGLPTRFFGNLVANNSGKDITERIKDMTVQFAALNRAVRSEAAICFELGEMRAVLARLKEYMYFIEDNFSENRTLQIISNVGKNVGKNSTVQDFWQNKIPEIKRGLCQLIQKTDLQLTENKNNKLLGIQGENNE